jgi:small conductance mechanosensitive channel
VRIIQLPSVRVCVASAFLTAACAAHPSHAAAETVVEAPAAERPAGDAERAPEVPRLDVRKVAHDREIQARLQSVLEATTWFQETQVRVDDGVVFLDGRTQKQELKEWAGQLARNTQDVAAVVNRIEVTTPPAWDLSEAESGVREIWRDFVQSLPFILFGTIVLALSAVGGFLVARSVGSLLQRRIRARLLRAVFARTVGIFVFLAGIYVVLRVAGLTQLALTVVGGTGLFGLAVGIAFRDITENFLASIFLSMQRPFETGDLVEVVGITGYVQQLNVRTTVLMNLEGNLVQVPNALVYKNTLRNFTVNPKRRESFEVGIGYEDPIDKAQELVRDVLARHPAVLDDPEPWVLADRFGPSTVQLRIYFWLNGHEHSWLKVRSSVIRLVKLAFQRGGISMPDESREVIFPQGVPVSTRPAPPGDEGSSAGEPESRSVGREHEKHVVATKAEGGLSSEAAELGRQAREAQPVGKGENLLERTRREGSK